MLDVTFEFEFELHEVWTEKSTVAAAGAGAGMGLRNIAGVGWGDIATLRGPRSHFWFLSPQ